MGKRLERRRLEQRRGKLDAELKAEEELAPLRAEIGEKELKLKKLRMGAGSGKKSFREKVESIRTSWNKARRILGVDTSKSRW